MLMIPTRIALNAISLLTLGCLVTGCNRSDLTISKPASEASDSEWVLVASKQGRFAALFPGTPTPSTSSLTVPTGGEIIQHSVTTEISGTIAYSVGYWDIQAGKELSGGADPIAVFLQSFSKQGKVIRDEEVTRNGRQGHRYVVERLAGQARVTCECYQVGRRFYLAMVVMPNQFFVAPKDSKTPQKAQALIEHFFGSLKFTP